ncbi:hypothetical protein NQ317_010717 [Molorchus minor]|uniref:Uncharacterized protein n=1 Tax=Molorchus minor TaxID=1323400 RepID=A0ABQ9K7Y2_9CUCU|nr:hypothetical protein NQ317_010717 [Molorchus minor]
MYTVDGTEQINIGEATMGKPESSEGRGETSKRAPARNSPRVARGRKGTDRFKEERRTREVTVLPLTDNREEDNRICEEDGRIHLDSRRNRRGHSGT